jgi:drug/metabolite transporter (DMT)-like permease
VSSETPASADQPSPGEIPAHVTARDHLILQGIVIVWGITAVLGKLISLAPQVLVTWRTGIAAAVLGLWLLTNRRHATGGVWARRALLNGFLIGLHWYLFFLSIRLGNVSVAITGLATCALWVALFEPPLVRGRRLHLRECVLALAVTGGVALVGGSDNVPLACLFTGIAAAAVAGLFSIFNARIVRHLPAFTMTFYEMVSATAFCAVLGLLTLRPATVNSWLPAASDWLPLLTLSLLCTVGAFSVCVWLQRRVPAFTIGLAANIEPVYGMVIAAAVFGAGEVMNLRFYAGAAIIIGCVIIHTLAGSGRNVRASAPEASPEPRASSQG